MQQQQQQQPDAQFYHSIDKCLQMVRLLRQEVTSSHRFISESLAFPSQLNIQQFTSKVEAFSRDITDQYERVEAEAKQLPSQTPSFALANRLSGFLLDTATNTSSLDTFTNAQDAFDWSDSTAAHAGYLFEILKASTSGSGAQRGRKFALMHSTADKDLHPRIDYTPSDNPHLRFEETFRQYMQNQESSKLRYVYRHMERGSTSSILEVKLLSIPNSREYMTVDRQPVCMLKFLLVVNNGSFDYIQFVAPNEDFHYLDSTRSHLDISIESKYEVYQRLTTQGNIVLHMISPQTAAYDLKNVINILLNAVGRFRLLDQPCRQCRKILKDFTPTTLSDTKKAFFHPTCC